MIKNNPNPAKNQPDYIQNNVYTASRRAIGEESGNFSTKRNIPVLPQNAGFRASLGSLNKAPLVGNDSSFPKVITPCKFSSEAPVGRGNKASSSSLWQLELA